MMETTPLLSPATRGYKRASYLLCILCCLLCASFTCFSLYTGQFSKELGYTPVQINTIVIFGEMGLYCVVPLFGILADSIRLSILAALSGVLYAIGYLGAYFTFISRGSHVFMSISFVLIAIATSGCYITCVVNSARLQKKSALLAIALPTTGFGASTLIFSQAFDKMSFFHTPSGLNIPLIFAVLSLLTFLVGCIAAISPVLGGTDYPLESVPMTEPDSRGDLAPDEYVPSAVEVSHIKRFFHNRQTWLLLVTFILASGPLEVYLNNLGLITKDIDVSTSSQVSFYSTFSTCSRLAVGAYLDLFGNVMRPSKILIWVLMLLSVTHFCLGYFELTPLVLSFLTCLSGWCYGCFFTLYPVIITRVWGIDGFATFWGMFVAGPALGTLIYGVLFSIWYQATEKWSGVYLISSVMLIGCTYIVYRLQLTWKH